MIRKEWNDFMYNPIEVVPGFVYNQYQTIKRAHLYYNSRFQNYTLYSGRERIFFNISKFRCDVATRILNIDTKDIRVSPLKSRDEIKTLLLQKELEVWMKNNRVGKLLNQIATEAPIFGSVVLKKNNEGPQAEVVDLRRFALDPTVENLQDSRFVSQKHYMTESEIRTYDGKWDSSAIEQAIQRFQSNTTAQPSYLDGGMINDIQSSPYIEVYERYGEVPETFLDEKGDPKKYVKALFIVAGLYDSFLNPNTQKKSFLPGIVLFKSKWNKEYPYKDYHYSKTRGRWLGIGVIEDLFQIQERFNEMANQKRIAMEVAGIQLFQSADSLAVDNILTDLQSGDVIKTSVQGSIQAVPNELRSLPAFQEEENQYNMLADKLSFANDVLSGGVLPASTPATNAVLQNNNATSVFLFKRQNLGIFLTEYFNDLVLPQLVKNLKNPHTLKFIGSPEELAKIDETYANNMLIKRILDSIKQTGSVPSPYQLEAFKALDLENLSKRGSTRYIDMIEGMFKDIDVEFDVNVTNEQRDVATLAQNTFQVFQTIASNQQILENPLAKLLFYKYAENIGVSPGELELAEKRMQDMKAQFPQIGQEQPEQNSEMAQMM